MLTRKQIRHARARVIQPGDSNGTALGYLVQVRGELFGPFESLELAEKELIFRVREMALCGSCR